jgi:thermostable 8-oxoguanine DNA glycosylase
LAFYNNKIEDEDNLAIWLNQEKNIDCLFKYKGIGLKTIDYLKLLSGNQAIAIDRHLFKFLEKSGITVQSYYEASQIYNKTADILGLSKYELDKKIWSYMSKSEPILKSV